MPGGRYDMSWSRRNVLLAGAAALLVATIAARVHAVGAEPAGPEGRYVPLQPGRIC